MKIIAVSNHFIFHQSELWDEINKHEDVDLTFLATVNELDEERKKMGYADAERSYLKYSKTLSDDELTFLFKDVDIVIMGSCEDKRVEQLSINVPNFVALSEHHSRHHSWITNMLGVFKTLGLEKKFYSKGVQYLLAMSAYAYQDYKHFGYRGRGYQFGYFPSLHHTEKEKDPFSIISFGRLLKLKRVEYAIYALEEFKKIDSRYHLTIIGEGDDLPRLQKIANKSKYKDSIKFEGFYPHDQIMDKLAESSIFIFPSNNEEGWGVALNEAMVSGCICFAGKRAGSSKFLINNKENGFLFHTRHELVKAIKVFKKMNKEAVEKMRRRATSTIEHEWNVEVAAKRLYELFVCIINHKDLDLYQSGPMKKIEHEKIFKKRKKKFSEETDIEKIEAKSKKNMTLGSIFGYLSVFVGVATGIILTPQLIAAAGEVNYGLYGIANSLIALFLLDFGLTTTINTYLAKLRSAGDRSKVEAFLATIYKIYLILDAVFLAILAALYFAIPSIYSTSGYTDTQIQTLQYLIIIAGGYALISLPSSCFTGVISTYEKFGMDKFIELLQKTIHFALTIVAIYIPLENPELRVLFITLATAISGIIAISIRFIYMVFYIGVKLDLRQKVERKELKSIFSFSVWSLVLAICSRLLFNVSPFIISVVSTTDQPGIFTVVTTIEGYIYTFGAIASSFFLAKVARTEATGTEKQKREHLQELAQKVGKLQFVVIALIYFGFVSCGQEFITTWMDGNPLYGPVYWCIVSLCAYQLVAVPEIVFKNAMFTEGHIKPLAITALIKAVVNMSLSFLFSYLWGALGASISITIACIIELIINNIMYKKYLKISLLKFFKSIYVRGLITVIISFGIALAMHLFLPLDKYNVAAQFVVIGFTFVFFYFICTFFITFNHRERRYYKRTIMRLLHIKTRRKMPQPESPLASGRKIKILQVVGSMINGGVEAFLYSYYRELHDYCEFTFVAFDDSTNIPSDMISELGGRVIVVPHVKNLSKFNKAMRQIFKEDYYDIVHSHLNTLSVFPLKIAEEFGVPVRIAHSHTTSNKKEIKRHIAKSILKLYSKSYSNVYFACSELAGRYQFGNAAYDDGEVTIIRNAIDVKKFAFNQIARKEIRDHLNLRDDQFVVGTIGRLVGTKNQKYLFDLAKDNLDTQYLIIGTGVLKQELRDQIAALHLNNVRVITPKRGIEDYYSALDTFVLPSFYEGLGLAAIEAEANGLYVVCSDQVPQETLLTGYGSYIKADKKHVTVWNSVINEHYQRMDNTNMLIEHGYEIKEASKFLLNKYRQLAKNVKW